MIVPDVNLLIYAYDPDSAFHAKASAWWQDCLSGDEAVGMASVVAFGFLRIATSARVFDKPMTAREAARHVRSWLGRPMVHVLDAHGEHVAQVLHMLESLGTAGNLVTDVQIAALAIENNAVVHSADIDFVRFPGLAWYNPITGARSPRLRRR